MNGNATKDGKLAYQQIPGWHGKCTPGEAFNASMCNQKLIGAQWFNAAWGGDAGIDAAAPVGVQLGPRLQRPRHAHRVHGRRQPRRPGDRPGRRLRHDQRHGPARPDRHVQGALVHRRTPSTASGSTSDLVAAIDQAVADGVDVINYSISGTPTNFRDPVEIAFLYAARAGIFVAASAGNSGPATATVAHPRPWITTVAAGTHNRNGRAP